jgi:hypothetical protein
MIALRGPAEGLFGPRAIALRRQQDAEIERSAGMAALVGPPDRLLGPGTITLLRQQETELECRRGMAALIGPPERILGANAVSFVRQKQTETECRRALLLMRVRVFGRGSDGSSSPLREGNWNRGVLRYLRADSAPVPELTRQEREQESSEDDDDDPDHRKRTARIPSWPSCRRETGIRVLRPASGSYWRRTRSTRCGGPPRLRLVLPAAKRTK